MVEIYKFITYIPPLLNQIFDHKNKNGSVKETNNNEVSYMRENFEFVSFCQRIFDDKKN